MIANQKFALDFKRHAEESFFLRSLEEDVSRCEALVLQAPNDAFARRTLVRTTFAEIEGLSAVAIDKARRYADDDRMVAGYTPAERMVLRDLPETAELNDKCEAHLNDGKHLTTKRAIKFALRMVGRGADSPPEVAYGVGGWDALVKSLGVRDRLMHPKVAQDLEVTDRELEQVRAARTWFITNYRGLQEAVYETAMAENHREMQEWADGKLDECADEQDG